MAGMILPEDELARRGTHGVELRLIPVRVRWSFDRLTTRDGHQLRCVLACSVEALDTPTEQRMLEETFLMDGEAVTARRVAEHFAPAFRTVLDKAVAARDIEQCLDEPARQQMLDELRRAGAAVAFSCGLELLEPFELHLESPTLRQQRLEQSLRAQAQQRQQDQLAHAEWAAGLLKQFEAVRHSLPPGRILQQFSPADQGKVFEVLTQAAAAEGQRPPLWLVSGNLLVRTDPRSPQDSPSLHELPADAGPLRSVNSGTAGDRMRLLIGAMTGVILVDPAAPGEAIVFKDDQIDSRRGFTRAVIWHDELWACHSDAGIVAWKIDAPERPFLTLRPPQLTSSDARLAPSAEQKSQATEPDAGLRREGDAGATAIDTEAPLEPKHLLIVDESRLLFSAASRLIVLTRDGQLQPLHLEPRSEIVALLEEPHHVVAVHADGTLCRRSRIGLEMTTEQARGEPLACAAAMPWLGDVRLLLGAAGGGIRCVSMEDPAVTAYTGWRGGVRSLAATADLVAALSPDRQRIVLWETWQSRHPLRELHLAALTRHRVADLHFAG